jgi:hypothetical protein
MLEASKSQLKVLKQYQIGKPTSTPSNNEINGSAQVHWPAATADRAALVLVQQNSFNNSSSKRASLHNPLSPRSSRRFHFRGSEHAILGSGDTWANDPLQQRARSASLCDPPLAASIDGPGLLLLIWEEIGLGGNQGKSDFLPIREEEILLLPERPRRRRRRGRAAAAGGGGDGPACFAPRPQGGRPPACRAQSKMGSDCHQMQSDELNRHRGKKTANLENSRQKFCH